MSEKNGRTIEFSGVYVQSSAAVGGKKEGEGPMKNCFDRIFEDEYLKEDSFEKAESMLQKEALQYALSKAGVEAEALDYIFAGDLLNQCIGSSFGIRDMGVPFIGLYGACSTMALSAGVAAQFVDSGSAKLAAAVTSSHFCSAERQFRYPLEYGNQRTPTSQWTATAAGALLLGCSHTNVEISHYTAGEIVDLGVKDANNMGAAMAPAACSTLLHFFADTGLTPNDFDVIFTGDLGYVGSDLLYTLTEKEGLDIKQRHMDCGKLMYDRVKQDVHAGGSGCGCVGSIIAGHIIPKIHGGEFKSVLVCGTGALLSTVSTQQGESIPSIAHVIALRQA